MGNLHEMFAYSDSNAVKEYSQKVVEKINLQKPSILEYIVYVQK